jgi:hypothetical protein
MANHLNLSCNIIVFSKILSILILKDLFSRTVEAIIIGIVNKTLQAIHAFGKEYNIFFLCNLARQFELLFIHS